MTHMQPERGILSGFFVPLGYFWTKSRDALFLKESF